MKVGVPRTPPFFSIPPEIANLHPNPGLSAPGSWRLGGRGAWNVASVRSGSLGYLTNRTNKMSAPQCVSTEVGPRFVYLVAPVVVIALPLTGRVRKRSLQQEHMTRRKAIDKLFATGDTRQSEPGRKSNGAHYGVALSPGGNPGRRCRPARAGHRRRGRHALHISARSTMKPEMRCCWDSIPRPHLTPCDIAHDNDPHSRRRAPARYPSCESCAMSPGSTSGRLATAASKFVVQTASRRAR